LGSTTLAGSNLAAYQTQWQAIGSSLTATGDMLLYGCNVAAGDVGQDCPRSREMLENALQDGFPGLLISDGYGVYRAWENRLRCWPHLMRKLRGLAESSDARVSGVGRRWKAS
jgi:hypothetical protein